MGVDLRVIIGHSLTSKGIMDFPDVLKRTQELKDVYVEEIQSKIEHKYSVEQVLSSLQREFSWENYTENDLLNSWVNNENSLLVDENGFMSHSLTTYFGILYFNRQTVEVMYLPEHKYANLKYKAHRKFIFNFSKAFAKFLGSEKIIYCSDTGETEIIECWATEGMSIESIINSIIVKFGEPSKILEEAIDNRFIIDDVVNSFIVEL